MFSDETIQQGLKIISLMGDQEIPFEQPENEEEISGEILVGTALGTGARFGLDREEIKEHTLITGRTGAGKTSLINLLLVELMQKGITFWAFDFKTDYRHLLNCSGYSTGKDFFVFDSATFRFNPLRAPKGVRPEAWVQVFTGIFGFSFFYSQAAQAS